MNFTPFGTTFSSTLPTSGAVAQFTTAKFAAAHQVGSGGGQVLGLLSADEAGVTYLRPVEANGGFTLNLAQQSGNSSDNNPQIITLPISVPGAKPGDLPQQQTLQIQVVNPGGGAGGEKFTTVPISIQPFQQGGATVLTVAYGNPHQDQGEAIQLQLQSAEGDHNQQSTNNTNSSGNSGEATSQTMHSDEIHVDETGWDAQVLNDVKPMEEGQEGGNQAYPVALVTHLPSDLILKTEETITGDKEDSNDKDKIYLKTETGETAAFTTTGTSANQWQSIAVPTTAMADYLSRLPPTGLPLSLHHFLKFSAETIKRESAIESSPLNPEGEPGNEEGVEEPQVPIAELGEETKGGKKKKKYKKKPPKPRRPRPGQVHIAVALDGTTLFCCPECNMAYPDKEILEQHLVAHKIERRFICDICGAGLKRKEHLERHKLGHNPERPYICSVCCKGFKRKEHLNLHFVIHSGEKSEVCPECGKGFHRKDHLRKHARSHLAKRIKDESVTHTLDESVITESGSIQVVQTAGTQVPATAVATTMTQDTNENQQQQPIIIHQATQSQH